MAPSHTSKKTDEREKRKEKKPSYAQINIKKIYMQKQC